MHHLDGKFGFAYAGGQKPGTAGIGGDENVWSKLFEIFNLWRAQLPCNL